jgi:hypothetical protein
MAEITKYARIRPPRNKNEDVPRSWTAGGVRIYQGGAGTPIKDEALLKRFKGVLGEKLEVGNSPFVESGPRQGFTNKPGE